MAEVEIISMLMPSLASVSNIVAATPGLVFMPAPTSDTLRDVVVVASRRSPPISAASAPVTPFGRGEVGLGHGEGDVGRAVDRHVLHDHVDVDAGSSARARNSRAAMPGWSGTPVTVTLASDVSWVTAEMIGCSIEGSSSVTQVPGSQVKLERTCSGTPWLRANSTDRRREHPAAGGGHLQHLVEADTRLRRRAVGHDAGVGGEHAGHVGVDLAGVGPERGGQGDRGGVGAAAAEEGDVVRGRHALGAGDDGHLCRAASASRSRSARTSRILALVWLVSVMMPAWLPVNDVAATPRSASAMHSSAMALRSPAVISMSISRPGWAATPAFGEAEQLVGLLAHGADTTTTTSLPWRRVRATWSATARMRSASATEVPPNFWTTRATAFGQVPVPTVGRIRGQTGRLLRLVGTDKT